MKLQSLATHIALAALACFGLFGMANAQDDASDANTCRAEGASQYKFAEGWAWGLDCAGSCPTGDDGEAPNCEERKGSDGKGAYAACSCDDAATPNNTCCQLVIRWEKGDDGQKVRVLGTKGDCPSCPASGACQVRETTPGQEAQAVCD